MKYLLLLGLVGAASTQRGNRGGRRNVDAKDGRLKYHFSWLHDGFEEYAHAEAVEYCNNIEGDWTPVSIEKHEESSFINAVIGFYRLDYIWTGGVRSNGSWTWPSGGAFKDHNWSHAVGLEKPQPDNREGHENCLAILNDFYQDGIKWHDVSCHYPKAIICEFNP